MSADPGVDDVDSDASLSSSSSSSESESESESSDGKSDHSPQALPLAAPTRAALAASLPPHLDTHGLSDYELLRLRNIQRNEAKLASLGLRGITSRRSPPSARAQKAADTRRRNAERAWRDRFAELCDFHARHGHYRISKTAENGRHSVLSRWLVRQRAAYAKYRQGEKSALNVDQVRLLEGLEGDAMRVPPSGRANNHDRKTGKNSNANALRRWKLENDTDEDQAVKERIEKEVHDTSTTEEEEVVEIGSLDSYSVKEEVEIGSLDSYSVDSEGSQHKGRHDNGERRTSYPRNWSNAGDSRAESRKYGRGGRGRNSDNVAARDWLGHAAYCHGSEDIAMNHLESHFDNVHPQSRRLSSHRGEIGGGTACYKPRSATPSPRRKRFRGREAEMSPSSNFSRRIGGTSPTKKGVHKRKSSLEEIAAPMSPLLTKGTSGSARQKRKRECRQNYPAPLEDEIKRYSAWPMSEIAFSPPPSPSLLMNPAVTNHIQQPMVDVQQQLKPQHFEREQLLEEYGHLYGRKCVIRERMARLMSEIQEIHKFISGPGEDEGRVHRSANDEGNDRIFCP